MYLALGIIILVILSVMTAIIIYTLVHSIKDGGELISKKNLIYIVPIYLVVYCLYIIASVYNGEKITFFYLFALIGNTADVLKFELNSALIEPILSEYPVYTADFVFACVLSTATIVLGVLSFFSQRIRNFIFARINLLTGGDVVIGDSEDSVKYVKNSRNAVLLGTDITRQRYGEIIKSGVTVLRMPLKSKKFKFLLGKKQRALIVFRDGNKAYTKIMDAFTDLRESGKECELYLEANQQEMKILKEKMLTDADKADRTVAAHISCFSKHELMARRFVVDYPITKYIPRDFFNGNYTLKSDKDVNIVFIGFGKVNYQLFRMCAMQFQFAKQDGNRLSSKPVHYYIYDNKEEALNNEFISRLKFEFDADFKGCDFPKPDKICDLHDECLDINSVEAKKIFKSLVTNDSFTYFIISLDNDLQDASYAQTVKRLLYGSENYRIFVRAKNNNGEKLDDENGMIMYFGDEKNLCSHKNIVNDDLLELAKRINLLYNKVSDSPEWLTKLQEISEKKGEIDFEKVLADKDHRDYMDKIWADLPPIEQDSNLYHALNLPFKLNLLGFDMVKGKGGASEDVFNTRYENDGREKDYEDYSFFFGTQSSNVLAFIEHSRWNALYITYDYRQMKKADIKKETAGKDKKGRGIKNLVHKDKDKKQHACLTTYYGLSELIAFKFEYLYPDVKLTEKEFNVDYRVIALSKIYAYDYMDLDRLYGEISAMGYILKDREREKTLDKDSETC